MWNRFVKFNLKITMFFASDFHEDTKRLYLKHPFAWMCLLVPIVGILGFAEIGITERLEEKRMEREEKQKHLK